MADGEIHKLKIKLGTFEFEAEGTADALKEQFQTFRELVEKQPAPETQPQPTPIPPKPPGVITETSFVNLQAGPSTANGEGTVTPASVAEDVLSRVFRREGDAVSLAALPKGDNAEADALIALIYASQRILNRPNITAVTLSISARQSGINLPRLDTVLRSKGDLVMSAGARRGRRYSLNNRGLAYAEALVRRIIE